MPGRAKIKIKSMKNRSERGPDGDLHQHRLRRPKKEGAGPLRVACGMPFEEQMGAKLEPNGVKMAFEIASKFEVEFEMPF